MKYCKNCGMLLEDTSDICIGCGLDMTNPDNVSLYPPNMQKKMEAEKKEDKTRKRTIVAIIVVFALLIALVVAIIFFVSPAIQAMNSVDDEEYLEDEWPEDEEVQEEPFEAEESTPDNRVVKDDEGLYYSRATLTDDGGNVIFNGLYPEDFQVTTQTVDYTLYSNRFPGRVVFSVGNADDTVHFTYMSPQQFWNKKSENKETRKNERDITYYMSFLSYDGAQGYAEALLKSSYSDAKKMTLVESKEVGLRTSEAITTLADSFKRQMTGISADYAHIGDDTTFAVMESESSAMEYRYEIVTKDNNTLFIQIYVPVIANNLYYASDHSNDRGTMIEWIVLGVYCYETGNEDLFDDFEPAFNVFMNNCSVNRTFFGIMQQYGEEIDRTVLQREEPAPLDAAKLAQYGLGVGLNDFNSELYNFVAIRPDQKQFCIGDYIINVDNSIQVAFLDPDKNKVFVSPAGDEYPGSGFEDMYEGTEDISSDEQNTDMYSDDSEGFFEEDTFSVEDDLTVDIPDNYTTSTEEEMEDDSETEGLSDESSQSF